MDKSVVKAEASRFDIVRADGAERAALLLATKLLEGVAQRVVRAQSLLAAVVVEGVPGRTENKREASKALSSAVEDLREIVAEIGE